MPLKGTGLLDPCAIKTSSRPEPRLLRFEKETSGVEAGTVIFESGEIIFGYPKIRRALMLNDDGCLIRITKLVMSTNDKTQALLEGEMW